MIPVVLCSMLNGFIGLSYLAFDDNAMNLLYSGLANNSFVAWLCASCIVGCSLILTSHLFISMYASKIDKLDDEIDKYQYSRAEMVRARDKYTEKLKEK